MNLPDSLAAFRKKLPLPVRVGYGWFKRKLSAHAIWDNAEFKKYYAWLQETQWWSEEQLKALQLQQLQALLQHAYENVPYYHRLFNESGLKPRDFVTLDDIRKLPVLTKEDVRNNTNDLIARNIDRDRLIFSTTGGSTGKPLGLYHDKFTKYQHEAAFIMRQRGWAGYHRGDRVVRLRGNLNRQATWDYLADDNTLELPGLDMNKDFMSMYIKKINDFKPKFIYSFPSSLEILARYMKSNGIKFTDIKAIFCESETLYSSQRELIEAQFGCNIFAGYGLSERVADAVECENHDGYHVSMEYGLLELVGKDGDPITQVGKLGRVVGTGFDTYCMPLIRYATDDLALYADHGCSCGRKFTLVQNFQGRIREFLVSKTGQLVPFGPLYSQISFEIPAFRDINELRFVQEEEGVVTIEVTADSTSTPMKLTRILSEGLYKWLDEKEFNVSVSIVDRLHRTARGKLPLLEQRLPIQLGDIDQTGNTGQIN